MIYITLRWIALFVMSSFLFLLGVTFGRMPVFQEDPGILMLSGSVFSLGFSLLYIMVTRGR